MAIVKHTTSKNAAYTDVLNYLTMKHEEVKYGDSTHYEPILDDNGFMQERDNYSVVYINSRGDEDEPEKWSAACARTNAKYNKNMDISDRKQHSYIISHPSEDREKMTMEDLLAEGRAFARKHLKGYDCLIAVHRDTDNDHIHIVINSVRDVERERESWMMLDGNGNVLDCEIKAGGKHQDSPRLRVKMNEWLMEYTHEHGYTVKDNNAIAAERRKNRYGNKNEKMREALLEAASQSTNIAELQKILESDYDMKMKVSSTGKTISILYPGNTKYVRLRTLGIEPEELLKYFQSDEYYYLLAEQEKKRRYEIYWRKYKEVREKVWKSFAQGQRNEFEEVSILRDKNRWLYIQNSKEVESEDGEAKRREMLPEYILEKNGYFEQREINNQKLNEHWQRIQALREYQNIAKKRQAIVRELMANGADEEKIKSALRNYEEAMQQLQYYAENPDSDYQGRRLKVAKWSLEQEEKRLNRAQQLKDKEKSKMMAITEAEYEDFQRNGVLLRKNPLDEDEREVSKTKETKKSEREIIY